jgi:hypothetical protein
VGTADDTVPRIANEEILQEEQTRDTKEGMTIDLALTDGYCLHMEQHWEQLWSSIVGLAKGIMHQEAKIKLLALIH